MSVSRQCTQPSRTCTSAWYSSVSSMRLDSSGTGSVKATAELLIVAEAAAVGAAEAVGEAGMSEAKTSSC